MATFIEVGTRILRDSALVAAEETPSAADLNFALEQLRSDIAFLSAKNIHIWNGGEDLIPDEYLTAVSRYSSLGIAPAFGTSDVATATLARKAIEMDLRALSATPATGSVTSTDYF